MLRLTLTFVLLAACSYPAKSMARPDRGAVQSESEAPREVMSESHYGDRQGYTADFDVQLAQAAFIGDPALEEQEGRNRLMIRKGILRLRTANPVEVGKRAVSEVKDAGGWVQQQRDQSFVFRIPAVHFDAVLASIEGMGAVVSRQIDAEDVTGEVKDLELRIRNARALRDRYAEILKQAKEVKDILAIEGELAKITEEIERLEGTLKRRMHDVSFSVLRLLLEAPSKAPTSAARSPFGWLTMVGVENVPQFRPDRAWSSRVDWTVPEGFADMGRTEDDSVRGWLYSPEGIRVVVRRFANKPRVDEAFWKKELDRELIKVRGYQSVESAESAESGVLFFRSVQDGAPTTYAVRLIVTKNYLTLVEIVGPKAEIDRLWTSIREVIRQVEEDA